MYQELDLGSFAWGREWRGITGVWDVHGTEWYDMVNGKMVGRRRRLYW
jgi:hypothetical protein